MKPRSREAARGVLSGLMLWAAASIVGIAVTSAAQATGQHSATELVAQFRAMDNPYLQLDIAKEMVRLHDPSVLPEIEPYLSDQRTLVKGNAALVFAGLGDDRGFQIILEILNNKSTNRRADRYYAAHLLGDLKDWRAVPILIPLLKDEDVNWIVPWSLAQIGDPSAEPPLIATLSDKSPDMRVLAIHALETMKSKQALPQIRALLNDNERIHFDGLGPVSEAARKAVAELERD